MGFWFSSVAKVLIAAHAVSASIAGTVTDGDSGDGIAGAVVSLTDLDQSAVTDSAGRYVFHAVPAGPQHVTVQRIGYSARTLHALVPREGTLEINIALRPEPIAHQAIEVDVRPAVPVRGLDEDATTTFPDRGLSMAAVRAHPLSAEPDAFEALSGGEVVARPETPSGLHIRGGASDQVMYLLDGIPVFSPYHVTGTFSAWNPDALSRLELLGSSPPPGFPESLSGAVVGWTRAPGSQFRTQGSTSTTQARVTIDGPIGTAGAGYLLSLRTGFPGVPYAKNEPSYLQGRNADLIAKLESPLFDGRARLLVYDSDSEIDAAAAVESEVSGQPEVPNDSGPSGESGDGDPEVAAGRNSFEWHGRSIGGEWARDLGSVAVLVRAWSAFGESEAVWRRGPDSVPELLAAERRDEGLTATVEMTRAGSRTAAGLRAQRSRTSYRFGAVGDETSATALNVRTPISAAFAQHTRALSSSSDLELALVGAIAAGDLHLSPRAQLRWRPARGLALTGGYARLHQFAQSLRNAESVVGNIFPADLYVGAGREGVPVARSDQAIVALELRPTAGVRFGVQAYARGFDGLALVAPRDGDPFATSGFVEGEGDAQGVSFEAGANGARYGIVASYGFQHVRFEYGDTTYVPDHGATHSIEAGVIVFPSTTTSVRLGATSVLGRRTTPIEGFVEWEACNLLDHGCEFAGSPQHRPGALGARSLPAYVRVDLGIAKHWHLKLAGRDGLVSLFGTVTNLFGRRNVLTIAADPETGELTELTMRPISPLVVGIDWRF